jgi:hypothetical protein
MSGPLVYFDSNFVNFAQNAFDGLINTFSKECKLIFTDAATICPNCILTPTGASTNQYKSGGPLPFSAGQLCPICEGTGHIRGTDGSAIINLMLDWEFQPWMSFFEKDPNADFLRIPGNFVVAEGYVTDLPSVLRADHCYMDINANFTGNKFRLHTDTISVDSLVRARYFEAVWTRLA